MSIKQTLKEKVIKGSIIGIFFNLLGSIFAYLLRIFYSHNLSIEEYGLLYAVLSIFLMFAVYLDLGFGYSIVYLLPKYLKKQNYHKVWNIFVLGQGLAFGVSIVLSLIFIFSAPLLAQYYFKTAGSEILIYIFCIFLVSYSLINGLTQLYSGMQKEKYYTSIIALRWFASLALAFLFYSLGFSNIIFFAVALSAGHLITALFYFVLLYIKHSFLTVNKISLEKKTFQEMQSFAVPAILGAFISALPATVTTFFLTLFTGVREVGIYNIIYPLATIPIILLYPLNVLILPLVSHLMEGEKDKLGYLIEKILEIIPFVVIYFSLFVILFPSASIGLIFGLKWLGKVELALSILCLGSVFLIISGLLETIALGIGKVKNRLKITTLIAIFGIPITAFLIYNFGITGAISSIFLIALISSIIFLLIIKEDISFKIPFSFYLKISLFSSTLFILIRIINIQPVGWIEYIVFGMIYTVIYVSFGYILRMYDKKTLALIVSGKSSKL